MPDERVMHFPGAMAQFGSHLAIGSSAADGKYHLGRMVVVDTAAVKQSIGANEEHAPVAWEKVVRSNVLIPQETGEIHFSDSYVVTAGREDSQLIAIPVSNGVSPCNDVHAKLDQCAGASILNLGNYDPFALVGLSEKPSEEFILASFLSSDRIDVIKLDKNKSKDALSVHKSFNAIDFVRPKIDAATLKNQRILTRKMVVTAKSDPLLSKVYFLLEQHSQKIPTSAKPKLSFLVGIRTSDLLANSVLTDSKIELWNLNDVGTIAGVQDLFIDDAKNEAYVLARVPEALFKIDLAHKSLIEVASICTEATSMALSPADDMIVIPCFKENRITSLSMKSLTIKATSKVLGRGPTFVVIDKTTGYIFCSFSSDGIVAILDDKLNYVGHLFNKAPSNRVGS